MKPKKYDKNITIQKAGYMFVAVIVVEALLNVLYSDADIGISMFIRGMAIALLVALQNYLKHNDATNKS